MIDDRKSKKVSTVNMELWKPRGQAKLETYDTVKPSYNELNETR